MWQSEIRYVLRSSISNCALYIRRYLVFVSLLALFRRQPVTMLKSLAVETIGPFALNWRVKSILVVRINSLNRLNSGSCTSNYFRLTPIVRYLAELKQTQRRYWKR